VRAYYDYVLRDTRSLLRETTRTMDVEFQHAKQFASGHQFLWGANLRRIEDQADDTVGFVLLPARKWLSLVSLFGQHEIAWHQDAFRLTTGLRFEHNDYTGWEFQPTLRLALHWHDQTLWTSVSRAVRTPSRLEKELFAPASPPYFFAGGPDFRSETLLSFEAGWRKQFGPGTSLTTTAYSHVYDHLHTLEGTTPTVEANGAEGRTNGLELFLDHEITPRWRLRIGGSRCTRRRGSSRAAMISGRGVAESSFPSYQAFLRNAFRVTPKLDLWLSFRRVGEVPGAGNALDTVPAYTELDARLGWQVRPQVELALSGRDLLDPSHPEIGPSATRREIPRRLAVSLRWEY